MEIPYYFGSLSGVLVTEGSYLPGAYNEPSSSPMYETEELDMGVSEN